MLPVLYWILFSREEGALEGESGDVLNVEKQNEPDCVYTQLHP